IDRTFQGEPSLQHEAAAMSLSNRLTVIAGGPGTGKTYTIARIIGCALTLAAEAGERLPHIAVAAPTGKAAARLTEQLLAFSASGVLADEVAEHMSSMEAQTIHRLLGFRFGRNRFHHHAANRLPHDLV